MSAMPLLAALLLINAAVGQVSPLPCIVDRTADLGVSYDLTSLAGNTYTYFDNRFEGIDPWQYTVSICADNPPPAGFGCEATSNDDGSPDPNSGKPGPAFQYGVLSDGTTKFCKRMGDTAAKMSVGLLFGNSGPTQRDNRMYARGLQINYTNGNVCRNPVTGMWLPRILSFDYECYAGGALNPPAALVLESTNCV